MSPKKLVLFCLADNPIFFKESVISLKTCVSSGSIFVVFEVTFVVFEVTFVVFEVTFVVFEVLLQGSSVCDATAVLVDCAASLSASVRNKL